MSDTRYSSPIQELPEVEAEKCSEQAARRSKPNVDTECQSRPSNRSSKPTIRTRANPIKKHRNSELERQRVANQKKQMSVLQQRLPGVDCKLSEIQTLRLTIEYIRFLERSLGEDNTSESALTSADFTPFVTRELQTVNSYTQRVKQELIVQGIVSKQHHACSNEPPCPFPPHVHGPFPSSNAHHSVTYPVVQPTSYPYYRFPNSMPQFVAHPSQYSYRSVLSNVVNCHGPITKTQSPPFYTY